MPSSRFKILLRTAIGVFVLILIAWGLFLLVASFSGDDDLAYEEEDVDGKGDGNRMKHAIPNRFRKRKTDATKENFRHTREDLKKKRQQQEEDSESKKGKKHDKKEKKKKKKLDNKEGTNLLGKKKVHKKSTPGSFVDEGDKKSPVKDTYNLYVIRHGQAEHNVGRCEDHPDPHLTTLGRSQVENIQNEIAQKPDVIFFSPLTRTIETTLYGFGYLLHDPSVTFIPNAHLQEDEAGNYVCDTGRPVKDLKEEFPQFEYDHHLRKMWFVPHEGKTERRKKFRHHLKKYLTVNPDKERIAIVAHHGAILGLLEIPWRELPNAKVLDCVFHMNEEKITCSF